MQSHALLPAGMLGGYGRTGLLQRKFDAWSVGRFQAVGVNGFKGSPYGYWHTRPMTPSPTDGDVSRARQERGGQHRMQAGVLTLSPSRPRSGHLGGVELLEQRFNAPLRFQQPLKECGAGTMEFHRTFRVGPEFGLNGDRDLVKLLHIPSGQPDKIFFV